MSQKNLHHAILFEGQGEYALSKILEFLKDTLSIEVVGNPDFHITTTDKFSIDNARTLERLASQTPFGTCNVFILHIETILHEAQNALLKLLEEPKENTHFVIIIPSRHTLLETVQSRLEYQGKVASVETSQIDPARFLSSSIGERVSLLEPIIKDKNRIGARIFLDSLEDVAHTNTVKYKRALSEIAFIRSYLNTPSSSLKMLLEHVAVTI